MIHLNVEDAQEFKDQIPETGIFEMYDISVLIEASGFVNVKDLDDICTYFHAAINVVDYKVKKVDFTEGPSIRISIAEVPLHVAERRSAPPKNPKKS
jgi:hypothetical protein